MNAALAETTLACFAREQLTLRLARLEEQWLCCSQCSSASAIHDIRVAIRRFGEPLRAFKKIFPKRARKQVGTELQQVMKLAGHTRDVDIVWDSFLSADIAISPDVSLFLSNERATAEAALRAALSVGVATQFATRWQRSLGLAKTPAALLREDNYPSTPTHPMPAHRKSLWQEDAYVALNARSVLPGLLEDYSHKGDCLTARKIGQKQLHGLRLSGKYLRYVLEIFRPVYGRRMDELISTLKETQSQLGDITDSRSTLAWLASHGIEKTPEGQQLQLFLDIRANKASGKFAEYWNDHWNFPVFRETWVAYLRRYAGQLAPQPLRSNTPGTVREGQGPSLDSAAPRDPQQC